MTSRTRTLAVLIVCLLLAALVARNGDVAALALVFLAYLGVGLLQSPSREGIVLDAQRSVVLRQANGRAEVEVRLSLHNRAATTVHLAVDEPLLPGARLIEGATSARVALQAGESTQLRYDFTAPRGRYAWESLRVVVADPLGVIETALDVPASGFVQIGPRFQKFRAIPFRPHSTLHAPGSIPARLGGSGTDFFDVREYQPGDPLRSLDWRLTARHPNKLFTKAFEQEEIAEVGLLLDARYRTELRVGGHSLFEAGVGAAASLAEMFLHQGHRLSLMVFGRGISSVFPGYGKQQLHRVMNCLSTVEASPEGSASAFNYLPIRMFPSRSLILVISPLTPTDKSLFQRLRAMGYQVVLISPDPLDLALPELTRRDETDEAGREYGGHGHSVRQAARASRIERQLMLREIAQLRVSVIDWPIRTALYPLVCRALMAASGQRLRAGSRP